MRDSDHQRLVEEVLLGSRAAYEELARWRAKRNLSPWVEVEWIEGKPSAWVCLFHHRWLRVEDHGQKGLFMDVGQWSLFIIANPGTPVEEALDRALCAAEYEFGY